MGVQLWEGRFGTRRCAGSVVQRILQMQGTLSRLGEGELAERINTARQRLRREGLHARSAVNAFALVCEVASRRLGLRHFEEQLIAGWVMLRGQLAEMDTGEGKTLAATLPACTAALAGIPVHVITVNDYLATRDAELMLPIYRAMGLTVSVVTEALRDLGRRRAAYRADVTYTTNKQVAFDYLRDRGLRGSRRKPPALATHNDASPVLRGLCFAIVDEADSVLVDEARTPLVLAREIANLPEPAAYPQALSLSQRLTVDRDYRLARKSRAIVLTATGCERLAGLVTSLGGCWRQRRWREDWLRQALFARHLLLRDQHYVLRDGKVQIIDEHTGRRMPDRSWELGLQQMVEAKEGCPLTPLKQNLARISYQTFFRRYLRLAGMTGTAREVKRELGAVYGLRVVSIPPRLPRQRRSLGVRVFHRVDQKWEAIVQRVRDLHQRGRPVLVGTRSVASSEQLSALLRAAGLSHAVLNARHDGNEAAIIVQAGQPGRITVATNMAGRGTDIRLATGVADRGGLHVILAERNEARRIDRQLFGRCARQGDPGSFEAMLSLEDELLRSYLPLTITRLALRLSVRGVNRLGPVLMRGAQRRAERQHANMRRQLLYLEEQLADWLAFTGPEK